MSKRTKLSFNLFDEDATDFQAVKAAVDKRVGVEQSALQVIRLAIAALKRQEKVK